MPPTKVCPQCKGAVPVRRKSCECCNHVFRSKAERNLWVIATKSTRAVESDSVKSARKAKEKLHKPFKESETREQTLHRQKQNNAHGKYERVTREWWDHLILPTLILPPLNSPTKNKFVSFRKLQKSQSRNMITRYSSIETKLNANLWLSSAIIWSLWMTLLWRNSTGSKLH